jgi:hypothetical protein
MTVYEKILQYFPIVISITLLIYSSLLQKYGRRFVTLAARDEGLANVEEKVWGIVSAFNFTLTYLITIVTTEISLITTAFTIKANKVSSAVIFIGELLLIVIIAGFMILTVLCLLDPIRFPKRKTTRGGIPYVRIMNLVLISSYVFFAVLLTASLFM